MIDSYSFGQIVVDRRRYTSDVIIFPDHVRDNWWRKEGHSLHVDDLKEILQEKPEVLVVGTGSSGLVRVPEETRKRVESEGIKLVVEPTEKACETFNQLPKSRRVVAALHLTC
jgi:hypothetical protein